MNPINLQDSWLSPGSASKTNPKEQTVKRTVYCARRFFIGTIGTPRQTPRTWVEVDHVISPSWMFAAKLEVTFVKLQKKKEENYLKKKGM